MKSILIPIDFPDTSLNALKYAFQFAEKMNFRVNCLYAYKKNDLIEDKLATKETITKMIEKRIQIAITENYNNPIGNYAFCGELLQTIQQIGKETSPELLIMGTKGVTGLKRILIGSNTTDVMASTDHTLLIIPGNFKTKPINIIMWASDLRPIKNRKSLLLLTSIAKEFDSEVRIAHI
ncbi:MAG: universal stress protein [Flavobacteriales bacterium]|nr:universal stress protein [Flavobacteriales bacterium]